VEDNWIRISFDPLHGEFTQAIQVPLLAVPTAHRLSQSGYLVQVIE
jgi:hypothetical protein